MILRRTALQFTERQKDRQMVIQIKLNFFKFGQFFFVLPAIIVLCTQNPNITIQYACSHEHMLLLWRLKWYMLSSFLSSMNLIQNPANFQDICSHPNMLLHWTLKLHLLVISLFQKKIRSECTAFYRAQWLYHLFLISSVRLILVLQLSNDCTILD